jgi:serine/threonine protein kinase
MKLFEECGDKFDSEQLILLREYAFQMLKGLEYIHSKNIAHCDIKAANILLSSDNTYAKSTVKLIDFGCSKTKLEKSLSAGNKITDFVVTIPWAAPEVIN